MAIKYTLDERNKYYYYNESDLRQRNILSRRVGAATPHRPLIFLLITTLILVVLFAMASLRPTDEYFPALITGIGVVHGHDILKDNIGLEDGYPKYILYLSVDISPEINVVELSEVSEPQWTQLKAGDTVGILYQRHRRDAKIRIQEVGLVALNNPIR